MNTLTLHEEHARANLNDRTAWRALVDHHEESLDVPHRIALRAVARMRFYQRRQVELTRATEAIKGRSNRAESIKDAIRACADDDRAWATSIYVIAGRSRPRFYEALNHYGNPVPRANSITVGARFVLKLARLKREVEEIEREVQAEVASSLFNY